MNTDLLLQYYRAVGHERFRHEVTNKKLPPEIQEVFDEITGSIKLISKLDNFPILIIIEEV